jgi:hypothetical protein
MRSVIIFGLVLFGVLACGRGGGRYLDRDVTPSEVIGSWQMTQASVQDFRDVGYIEPIDPESQRIEIRADGTCLFKTLPIEVVDSGRIPRIEGPCTWDLKKIGHQALTIDISGRLPLHTYYHFREGDEGLVMWQYLTDPDAWRFVEYVKAPVPGR